MPVRFGSAPDSAKAALEHGARLVRAQGDGELGDLLEAAGERPESSFPHEVLAVPPGGVRASAGALAKAASTGWRFLLDTEEIVAAELHRDPVSGELGFADISMGARAEDTRALLDQLAGDKELRPTYTVNLLRVPDLLLHALWLRPESGGDEILIPLSPAPDGLTPGRRYTQGEFDRVAAELARSMHVDDDMMEDLIE